MSDIKKKNNAKKADYPKPIAADPVQTASVEEGVTVSVEMGGKSSGPSKSVKEAAKKLKQMDKGKEEGDFRKTLEEEGAIRAEVYLQVGHDVSSFQAQPDKPGSTNNPLQFAQVNCIKQKVEATNGACAIRVPIVRGDIRDWSKSGVLAIDLSASKEVLKRPGKDEEVDITLTQTWEKATISRRTIVRESDTTKNVEMVPHDPRDFPNMDALFDARKRRTSSGRIVVSAEQLKRIAEYASKHGDGTILLDIADHETQLYCEVPVDECGVAEIIVCPFSARDISDPYRGAVKITER